jgi:hypothetical protein
MGSFGLLEGVPGIFVGRGENASAGAGASHDTSSLGSSFSGREGSEFRRERRRPFLTFI